MKRLFTTTVVGLSVIVFIGYAVVVSSRAQTPQPRAARAAALPCAGGSWTPTPVQHVESGDSAHPEFHTVYGLSCGGNVYMVRFGNQISGRIVIDILGKTPVGCPGGTWTPTPVQHVDGGSAVSPVFHTVWGLACGGNIYMVRFGNTINGNNIVVDILGKTPVQ
jgi:hypothetical protein